MKQSVYLMMLGILCGGILPNSSAYSISVNKDAGAWWGYNGETTATGTASGFIMDGKVFSTQSQECKKFASGTYGSDEGAIVGLVAETIYEHGGKFCPYQIQCNNKDKEQYSYTKYYYPMCGNSQCSVSNCVTLCESGYTGSNCSSEVSGSTTEDTTDYTTKFSNIKLRTDGKGNGEREKYVMGFNSWGKDPESDVILGVIKYLKHGVIARPIQLECKREGWKVAKSCVKNVAETGKSKLLCADRYVANSAGTDCVVNWCAGYSETSFNSTLHTTKADGACQKFVCKDSKSGFDSLDTKKCIECENGVGDDGVCKSVDWCSGYSDTLYKTDQHTMTKDGTCKKFVCTDSESGFDGLNTKKCIKCENGFADDGTCKPAPATTPESDKKQEEQSSNQDKSSSNINTSAGYCDGFNGGKYNKNIHDITTDGGCKKYFCKEKDKAFPKDGDYTCADCKVDLKNGPNENGVCTKCDTGNIYNSKTKECEPAKTMEKGNLLYGDAKTSGGKKFDSNWCWTKTDSDEYKNCVNKSAE